MVLLQPQCQQQQHPKLSRQSSIRSTSASNLMSGQNFHTVSEYREALAAFAISLQHENTTEAGKPSEMYQNGRDEPKDIKDRNPLIDEFFDFISYIGRPMLSWAIIQPVFIWKLQTVINDMMLKEAKDRFTDDLDRDEFMNNVSIREMHNFVINKAQTFTGTPFTFQRLCELISTPTRHYRRIEPFLQAIERTINVATCVDEQGQRITGAEELPPDDDDDGFQPIPVERNFIVSVDEIDDPLPQPPPAKRPTPADHHSPSSTTDKNVILPTTDEPLGVEDSISTPVITNNEEDEHETRIPTVDE